MAPVLSGVWWGPEASLVRSEVAADAGAALWSGSGQLVLAVVLSTLTVLLLVSVLLLLCASCNGQKKAVDGHEGGGDHENLVNGESEVSEMKTVGRSADTPATNVTVSSSANGPLTSGTILPNTQDTSPQPSEEMLSSQSELRSSKCPQDRQLPSIPPNDGLPGDGPAASGDSTYEVVKEMAAASRDASAEDSLYETVKELKEAPAPLSLPNGTGRLSPGVPPHHQPALLNGRLSPCVPERGPLCAGAEYASIDLKKKSRHSADMESRRRSNHASAPAGAPLEEPEEEPPPPVPEKVLEEGDNQPVLMNGSAGAGLHNGEFDSPLSPAPGFDEHAVPDAEAAVYSSVHKPKCGDAVKEEDKEHDYSSIAEIKGLVAASSSSELYATVRDLYPQAEQAAKGAEPVLDSGDPGYETIRVPKTSSSDLDDPEAGAEPDYASVGEVGPARDVSRL